MIPIWKQFGLDQMTYSKMPNEQKKKLIIRAMGIKIFSCCEQKALHEDAAKGTGLLFEKWCEGNAEEATIRYKYPHAVISGTR